MECGRQYSLVDFEGDKTQFQIEEENLDTNPMNRIVIHPQTKQNVNKSNND